MGTFLSTKRSESRVNLRSPSRKVERSVRGSIDLKENFDKIGSYKQINNRQKRLICY